MPSNDIPLTLQTAYADLLDRAASDAFRDEFAEEGSFVSKTVRGRRYWYFQSSTDAGRKQRYVGPETPELLERIRRHKEARHDQRDRQTLVSTLVRSAFLPRPIPKIGEIVAALAETGVFRLRGVMVGTTAYQTYSGMLGVRLSAASVQTTDIDIAQFKNVSIAVEERLPPVLAILKQIDNSFRDVPHLRDGRRSASYQASDGIRVDFLTPNTGPETDAPAKLPALGTDAQQLRFLDYLIHEPEPAVVLYGTGIFVTVPAPQRFAIHKLIISQRRREDSAKRKKDLVQAEVLLEVLVQKRRFELRKVWNEAFNRGKTWRTLMAQGISLIDGRVRDQTLGAVGATREIVPGIDLKFAASAPKYEFDKDIVVFPAEASGIPVRCAISREALEDHFGADKLDAASRMERFRESREQIQRLARLKYLHWPVDEVGSVLLKTEDIQKLNRLASQSKRKLA